MHELSRIWMAINFLAIIPFSALVTLMSLSGSVNMATVSNAHAGFILQDEGLNEDDG